MVGRVLAESLVWPVIVEVTLVLAKDAASVTLVVDQHSVGAFSAEDPDEPFGVAVGPGRRRWSPDNLYAFGGRIPRQKRG